MCCYFSFEDCCYDVLTLVYMQITHPWFEDRPEVYRALCDLWASEHFQVRSRRARNSGTSSSSHTLGGNGYVRKAKRLVRYAFNFFHIHIPIYTILTSTYRKLGLESSRVT
jgi:hypothetical protein